MPASAPSSASAPISNIEMLSKEDWIGRRLIADKFRDRCAFIAGDAAHIWVPYAGYGMNAGIADAMNLSWLLAAHLNGWAASAILDAYEAERWPITSQVSRFAMSHAEAEIRRRGAVPGGDRGRRRAGRAGAAPVGRSGLRDQRAAICLRGTQLRLPIYDRSPIIAYDGESAARPTRWPATRRRPCRAAARRISGLPTAARSMTPWDRVHAAAIRPARGRVTADGCRGAAPNAARACRRESARAPIRLS